MPLLLRLRLSYTTRMQEDNAVVVVNVVGFVVILVLHMNICVIMKETSIHVYVNVCVCECKEHTHIRHIIPFDKAYMHVMAHVGITKVARKYSQAMLNRMHIIKYTKQIRKYYLR